MPVIDYYLSLQSPWSCLGHDRIVSYAAASGSRLNIYPCQFGEVFAATGGLPLPKRSPQRQAYRLLELQRWSAELGIEMNIEPAHFPARELQACLCTLALRESGLDDVAVGFAGAVLNAVWKNELDIGEEQVLVDLLAPLIAESPDNEMDVTTVLELANKPEIRVLLETDTKAAIARGVFGAPAYVVDDELFWGQDRLSFVAAKLGVEPGLTNN